MCPQRRNVLRAAVSGLSLLGALTGFGATFTTQAYVWQRQSSPEVAVAMRHFSLDLQGYCVLAAEVSWAKGEMKVVRVAPDYGVMGKLSRSVGLAVRLGSYGKTPQGNDVDANKLAKLISGLLAEARAQGLEPAELQIDFDCPESKLAGFTDWLRALRAVTGKTPLIFTALPAWLKRAEFVALAHAADGFILQVHSLDKPTSFAQDFTLCDPAREIAWIRQAEQVHVPFRVALPTHGYVLGFERAGNYLGLSSEGPRPAWPDGSKTRLVRSDPATMLELAEKISVVPASHCTGIIWFRLPVAGDRLAWNEKTFAAVLRKEIPLVRLALETKWSESGLVEITLLNTGETTEPLPEWVTLNYPSSEKMLTGDGLGGFRLEMRGSEVQAIARADSVPADVMIAPGRRMKIAWLRFAHDVALSVSLAPRP